MKYAGILFPGKRPLLYLEVDPELEYSCKFSLEFGLLFYFTFDSWFWLLKISILINMGIIVVSEHMEKKELIENITEESEATQIFTE